MVALPSQLFYNTQIPACLWFMARNKQGNLSPTGGNKKGGFRNRSNEILFIDAREMGTMISRKQRELTDNDIAKISDTYHNWRSKEYLETYKDIPAFCQAANIQEVRKNHYILTPGRYIDFAAEVEDGVAFEDKMQKLTATLKEQMQKASQLDQDIKCNLKKIGFEI